MSEQDTGRGIWVTSDLNPDGSASYLVTVSATGDVALSLAADAAVRYVAAVFRAAVIAQHDAAVMAQLSALGLDKRTAGQAVVDMRQDREPVQDAATAPLRFEPIVSAFDGAPYVHVWAGKQAISQWTPDDCFQHASHVMEALAGVDLDSAYYRYLVGTINIDKALASAVVNDLGNYGTGLRNDPTQEAKS
jgi:hypothetical protein